MNRNSAIHGLLLLTLLAAAPAKAGSTWVIDWWTIDAGGEMVTIGGAWTLSGTVGQWDATGQNHLSGGTWSLTGGFWAGTAELEPPQDALFSDRFES